MRYLMGHLRGAVSVPYKKLQAPDGRLGPPEQLAAAFGDVGLGDDVTPILYDHQDGRNAAMATWVLEYLGRTDVHIMDLRYEAWKDEGREVLYRPVVTRGANFTVRLNLATSGPRWMTLRTPARPRWWTPALAEEYRGEVRGGPSPRSHSRRHQSPPRRPGGCLTATCMPAGTRCGNGWPELASRKANPSSPTAAVEFALRLRGWPWTK